MDVPHNLLHKNSKNSGVILPKFRLVLGPPTGLGLVRCTFNLQVFLFVCEKHCHRQLFCTMQNFKYRSLYLRGYTRNLRYQFAMGINLCHCHFPCRHYYSYIGLYFLYSYASKNYDVPCPLFTQCTQLLSPQRVQG